MGDGQLMQDGGIEIILNLIKYLKLKIGNK